MTCQLGLHPTWVKAYVSAVMICKTLPNLKNAENGDHNPFALSQHYAAT